MMLDKELQLDSALDLDPLSIGTTYSTNCVDLWKATALGTPVTGSNVLRRDLGRGEQLYAMIKTVLETGTTSDGATCNIAIGTATATDGTGFASAGETGVVAAASWVIGDQRLIALPPELLVNRYLMARIVIATGTFTAGKVGIDIVMGQPQSLPA